MSGRIRLDEVLVVEGRYDKCRLDSLFDAVVVETDGFSIFHDEEKIQYIARLGQKKGVIILTDSDAAGFRIRTYLTQRLSGKVRLRQAYIPDVFGKEKRKSTPSKEGKLGVEGVDNQLILNAVQAVCDGSGKKIPDPITREDLYEDGLMGSPDSADRRRRLLTALGLPARLSVSRMLPAINTLCTKEQYCRAVAKLGEEENGG